MTSLDGETRRANSDPRGRRDGVVVENRGALFEVMVEGTLVRCLLRGRLRQVKRGQHRQAATPVAAGDRVRVTLLEPGRGVIEEVLPRDTGLSRAAAGSRPLGHTLVANVDQAVVVFAAAEPRPDLFLLDRMIVAAVAGGLEPLICVSKCDLVDGELLRAQFAVYRQWFRVLFTSAALAAQAGPEGLGEPEQDDGIAGLAAALKDRRSVFCGPSGVGKSSLPNAVAPGLGLRVSEVGAVTHKGRHTTSSITLLELPFGGWVADTAGLRQFAFWEVAPDQVSAGFPDLAPYLGRCQYPNCSHRGEQGCAVRAEVRTGAADARRLRSYLQLVGGST